jgi:hypothetical protein
MARSVIKRRLVAPSFVRSVCSPMKERQLLASQKWFGHLEWMAMKDVPGWQDEMKRFTRIRLEDYADEKGYTLVGEIKEKTFYDEMRGEVMMRAESLGDHRDRPELNEARRTLLDTLGNQDL